MKYVLDSSVALKWVLLEADSGKATGGCRRIITMAAETTTGGPWRR